MTRLPNRCGKWRKTPDGLRIVCGLTRGHCWRPEAFAVQISGWRGTPHQSARSPWRWWDSESPWMRDWTCRGLLDDGEARCGKHLPAATENQARAKRWRVWWPGGATEPEVLCPACGRPDPVTAGLCRDLERSLRPSG